MTASIKAIPPVVGFGETQVELHQTRLKTCKITNLITESFKHKDEINDQWRQSWQCKEQVEFIVAIRGPSTIVHAIETHTSIQGLDLDRGPIAWLTKYPLRRQVLDLHTTL